MVPDFNRGPVRMSSYVNVKAVVSAVVAMALFDVVIRPYIRKHTGD